MRAATFLLGGLILAGLPDLTVACSCIHGTAKQELKRAEAVFLGEIVDATDSGNETYPLRVTLRVERYWKGKKTAREIRVLASGPSRGNCSMPLAMGRYLVYAYRKEGQLVTWTCSRTKPEAQAAEEMQELGRGVEAR